MDNGIENSVIRAMYDDDPEQFRKSDGTIGVIDLRPDSELSLIRGIFFDVDWEYAGMGEPVGKKFDQITFYVDANIEHIQTLSREETITLIHQAGKAWIAGRAEVKK